MIVTSFVSYFMQYYPEPIIGPYLISLGFQEKYIGVAFGLNGLGYVCGPFIAN